MNVTQKYQSLNPNTLSAEELKYETDRLLKEETSALHNELEELLLQKERLEHLISRKSDELQHLKYKFFDSLEAVYADDEAMLMKLHKIKIQSIDLLDILEEMVESAILTTLEKGSDIEETLHEIIKEITFQTLNANVLNAVRVRRILTSIVQSAINIAEATPNQAEIILRGTLLGIRTALFKSIEKFHQYLLYVPDEVKTLYRNEYQTIEDELGQVETLLVQVIHTLSKTNPRSTIAILEKIGDEIRFDTEELTALSKETVTLLRTRLSALKQEVKEKGSKLLKSASTQEAKAMGTRAWSVAKKTMEGAIKTAKEVMDKK